MRTFKCTCGNILYFENSNCMNCGRIAGYLPDREVLAGLDQVEGMSDTWQQPGSPTQYRRCHNYVVQDICNWMIPVTDGHRHCKSCRLSSVIPDLDIPGNRKLWQRMERAKRRLLYTLGRFRLPIVGREEDPVNGLSFQFLQDPPLGPDGTPDTIERVMTGHDRGLITINLAEADPTERERQREVAGERYRTVLGHFRHEIGHYYWDQLVTGDELENCRALFGDERIDYAQSLSEHYRDGPPPGWQDQCISAYATAHPWEDWAETWAHYLHMVDALETAAVYGFALRGRPIRSPEGGKGRRVHKLSWYSHRVEFDALMRDWSELSVALNAMSRSMGQADWYPFVVTPGVSEKLRFVHDVIHRVNLRQNAV